MFTHPMPNFHMKFVFGSGLVITGGWWVPTIGLNSQHAFPNCMQPNQYLHIQANFAPFKFRLKLVQTTNCVVWSWLRVFPGVFSASLQFFFYKTRVNVSFHQLSTK